MKQRSKRYSFTLVAVVMAMALCLLSGCLGAPAGNTAQSENVTPKHWMRSMRRWRGRIS